MPKKLHVTPASHSSTLCGYHPGDPKMKIIFYYRKDVRLPVQLQRAMAAEAEAAREARAKVNFLFDMISNFS